MNHRKLLLPGMIAAVLAVPAMAQDPAREVDRKADEVRQAAPRPAAAQPEAGKDRKPEARAARDRKAAARAGEEQPDEPEEEDR